MSGTYLIIVESASQLEGSMKLVRDNIPLYTDSVIISEYNYVNDFFHGFRIEVIADEGEFDNVFNKYQKDPSIFNICLIGGLRLEKRFHELNIVRKTLHAYEHDSEISVLRTIHPFNEGEMPYLNLIEGLIKKSTLRETRNAKTISTFGSQIEFDLKKGFPLLTTKKMFWKGIIAELLFMLKGQTDSKILVKDGVKIWEPNTTVDFIRSRGLPYREGDMGPMYGYLWRHFGYKYEGCDYDYKGKGHDQLLQVINELINSPTSRRIVMTTFDPTQVSKSVLPPCHGLLTQFYVDEDEDGTRHISCKMIQRSADIFLGLPFNIASYAALVHILCKITGYQPNKLIISLGDAHIYESHIEQCQTQINRLPYDFPNLVINKEYDALADPIEYIENLQIVDFVIENYKSHPHIKADMIA